MCRKLRQQQQVALPPRGGRTVDGTLGSLNAVRCHDQLGTRGTRDRGPDEAEDNIVVWGPRHTKFLVVDIGSHYLEKARG